MFKSAGLTIGVNFNKISPNNTNSVNNKNIKNKPMTKVDQYNHNNHYVNHQQHQQRQSKQSSTISLNVHDTNDIRYSNSNTQLQLQRLSLSASLIDIYFSRQYRSPDVLVVAGSTMILIGLGAILIGTYVYFNEDEFQEMTFLVGFAMAGIGFICCSCRIILFGPPLFNCCTPKKPVTYTNNQRRLTNPPFFTAASSAMSAITSIGVRFHSARSLSGVSQVINIDKNLESNDANERRKDQNRGNISASHTNSLESIETIKVEEYPSNDQIKPINPKVLQYISKLGSKT